LYYYTTHGILWPSLMCASIRSTFLNSGATYVPWGWSLFFWKLKERNYTHLNLHKDYWFCSCMLKTDNKSHLAFSDHNYKCRQWISISYVDKWVCKHTCMGLTTQVNLNMNYATILTFVNKKLNCLQNYCTGVFLSWNFKSLPTILGSLQKKNVQVKCERTLWHNQW
jgi:hypothetical protein